MCEIPCYMGIPNAFGALGHWVESVPQDAEGPIPGRLRHGGDGRPVLIYLCSELHNPMGTQSTDQFLADSASCRLLTSETTDNTGDASS